MDLISRSMAIRNEEIIKTCAHCNHKFEGNFCPNCGKSIQKEEFNASFLWEKFIDAFDLSKGFLHTILLLFIRPGTSIRKYLSGKTAEFSNPFKICLILGAISTWIAVHYQFFGEGMNQQISDPLGFGLPSINGYNKHSGQYFLFFSITGILIFSFFSWIVYFRQSYNFIEHLVLNIYIAVGQFVIFICYSPVLINWNEQFIRMVYGSLNFGYNLWVILTIFGANRVRWILMAGFAVSTPYFVAYYFNYFLYRLSPPAFWAFLDAVLH